MVHQLRLYASTTGGAWVPSLVGELSCPLHLVIWPTKLKKKKKDHFTVDLPPIPFLISFSKKEKNSINLEMFIA